MDISGGMIKQYNLEASKAGYDSNKMHAVHGDLLSSEKSSAELDKPEFFNFDLIVMCMAIHHVHDQDLMVKKLTERLADDGVLLIIDGVAADESGCKPLIPPEGPVKDTVHKFGFMKEAVMSWFDSAGLEACALKWFSSRSQMNDEGFEGDQQLFLAKGVKRSLKN